MKISSTTWSKKESEPAIDFLQTLQIAPPMLDLYSSSTSQPSSIPSYIPPSLPSPSYSAQPLPSSYSAQSLPSPFLSPPPPVPAPSRPTPPIRSSSIPKQSERLEEEEQEEKGGFVMDLDSRILSEAEEDDYQDDIYDGDDSSDSYGMTDKKTPISSIEKVQKEVEEVKNVMITNIEANLQRGEKLEEIVLKAEMLQQQSGTFKKSAQTLKRRMFYRNLIKLICCCPCMFGVYLWEKYQELAKKAALFDNVLADTENAFQTLAKLLIYLKEWTELTFHPYLYLLFGWLFNFINSTISFVIVLSSTIVLILPSFFTLLIVRTKTIEKESKAFGGNK